MNDEFDWGSILNVDFDGVEDFDFFATASPPVDTAAVESWEKELEELLLNDDNGNVGDDGGMTRNGDCLKDFELDVSDLLINFPDGPEILSEVVAEDENKNDKNSPESVGDVCVDDVNADVVVNDKEGSPNFESNCDNDDKSDDDIADDPNSKKRKRQLRNRDAAMRSRERKKKFVKELEMKSRYFEEECRRLGRLLNWCYSENQMLRMSLQTYGAPMTKPESAVLLLESLLLGSLVWLMVNICLLPQPKLPLSSQCVAKLVSVDRKDLESAVPRGKDTKISQLWMSNFFMRTSRCRASRTKMKTLSAVLCF